MRDLLMAAIGAVEDPEMAVSLVDLGVLRSVELDGRGVRVVLRATRLACPGRGRMELDVAAAVRSVDEFLTVEVEWDDQLWSDADVTPAGRVSLAQVGCTVTSVSPVRCPYCSSGSVRREGDFGGSLCKRPYTCRSCGSTFDLLRGSTAIAVPSSSRGNLFGVD